MATSLSVDDAQPQPTTDTVLPSQASASSQTRIGEPRSRVPSITSNDDAYSSHEKAAPNDTNELSEKDELRKDLNEKDAEHTATATAAAAEEAWAIDPLNNPRNWSLSKKWVATGLVSLYTFISPLASSMMAPGLTVLAPEYGITNPTILALTLSIFLLSFAIGPLFLAPLSEMYGRAPVLHISNVFSFGFSIGCALAPNTGALIGFRFLAGFSGSAPIAVGGGVVADLFAPRDRASAMALYSLGPLIGPVIGPVMGGFIASSVGIKWVFVMIACLCAATGIIAIPLLRETYEPVIRRRLAKKAAADPESREHVHVPVAHVDAHGNPMSKAQVMWVNLERPIVILFTSLVCFLLSLYMAFIYGIYYLMFATFSNLFKTVYGFGPGISGLAYIGLGVGFCLATIFGARFGNIVYSNLATKNGGVGTPEMRIPALIFGSLFVPVGLFWYGWSAEAGIHWIMPIIGTGIFGFGFMTAFLPIQLYLVDSFTHAASATAAASVFRSTLGFAFPLFGQQMYAALGTGGGNSLLAGLAIVLGIPFPIWLYFNGAKVRARSPLTR